MLISNRPVIGITADATAEKYQLGRSYVRMVTESGGTPVILPCQNKCIAQYLQICNGIVLTGGDDPDMSKWGLQTHPKAKPMDPERQEFELRLLDALQELPQTPALGICLGMQLMGLHAGGQLDQHLPDHLPTANDHWGKCAHKIEGELGQGVVHSHHRQALIDPGNLQVVASAADGVIEAVRHEKRPFYLGVQWHPERTDHPELGLGLFRQLISAARQVKQA